jgi:type II secretory pathway pseudopilin PulG
MTLSNKAGFTIIETMLFLGITGLLVMGVLVGTGASINTQRYRDSITSLQSLLQQQFSNVSNVDNNRGNSWTCDNSGAITAQEPGSGTERGQSDCVILGRLITTTNAGHTLLIRDVVGNVPSGVTLAQNDLDVLKQYNIQLSPVTNSSYDIEWDASVVKPGGDIAASFSILILQSPLSGIIRTFIDPAIVVLDSDIASLVKQSALIEPIKMCVNSNGLFTGSKMAVVVTAGASSASGVETLGDNSGC